MPHPMTPPKFQMTVLTVIGERIASLITRSSNEDDGPTGADAVRTAVNEFESLRDNQFTATLGEPDIVEAGGRYFNDPKVVIPIYDVPFDGADRLVFDLPEGRNDEFAIFNELLTLFNLDFSSLEELNGETVPVTFIGGNASVVWDEVVNDTDKGGEADDEDVEDSIPDESGVTIEEETISANGDEEEDDG